MAEMAKTIYTNSEEPTVHGYNDNASFAHALGAATSDTHYAAAGRSRGPFMNTDTGRSIRSAYDNADYEFRRPNEAAPRTDREIMLASNNAYHSIGIVRNVVDLMSDFGSQGIKLIHPNKKIERFYQKWFEKVHGKDRSERFLNQFYRLGNVVVERLDMKINTKEKNRMSAKAAYDTKPFADPKVKKNVIPGKYIFHAPMTIEHLGAEASQFLGNAVVAIKLPSSLTSKYGSGVNPLVLKDIQTRLKRKVPEHLLPLVMQKKLLPLNVEDLSFYHYKKDDWDIWGKSMLNAIMSDLIMFEKLKLADKSALDGVISSVRVWTLGDMENKIAPTPAGMNRLGNILASNVGGGTIDLVWTPDIKFEETASEAYKFLGPEKYNVTLSSIYDGLGIPSSLTTSTSKQSGASTDAFISLKVLQERLQYGRDQLIDFWSKEIERVRIAMGFARGAQVSFEHMVLTDAQSELNLMIQLSDRNLISDESLLEKFRQHPEIEKLRIRKEQKDRDDDRDPKKASPYHNPQYEIDLLKIYAQRGVVTPSETGIELEEKKEGEETFMEQQAKQQIQKEKFKPTGSVSDGRPKGASDTKKRKKKVFVSQISADLAKLLVWTNEAYKKISSSTNPVVLASYGKSNVRSLTVAEKMSMENLNFRILCGMKPYERLSSDTLTDSAKANIGNDDVNTIYKGICELYEGMLEEFISEHNREPSIDEKRSLQCAAYALSMVE